MEFFIDMKKIVLILALFIAAFTADAQAIRSTFSEIHRQVAEGSTMSLGVGINWISCVPDTTMRLYLDASKTVGGRLTTQALALDSIDTYLMWQSPEYRFEQIGNAFEIKAVSGNVYCIYRQTSY